MVEGGGEGGVADIIVEQVLWLLAFGSVDIHQEGKVLPEVDHKELCVGEPHDRGGRAGGTPQYWGCYASHRGKVRLEEGEGSVLQAYGDLLALGRPPDGYGAASLPRIEGNSIIRQGDHREVAPRGAEPYGGGVAGAGREGGHAVALASAGRAVHVGGGGLGRGTNADFLFHSVKDVLKTICDIFGKF